MTSSPLRNTKRFSIVITALIFWVFLSDLRLGALAEDKDAPAGQHEKTLTETGTAKTAKNQQTLLDAALKGDTVAVRAALKAGATVNGTDEAGRTALMLASYDGHTATISLLIDNGANVNACDNEGRTAFMYAASGPNHETVQLLIDKKADVNLIDKVEKWSALMFAAAEGQTKVVETLLKGGADKTLKDKDGDTALDFATKNKHEETVRVLKAGF